MVKAAAGFDRARILLVAPPSPWRDRTTRLLESVGHVVVSVDDGVVGMRTYADLRPGVHLVIAALTAPADAARRLYRGLRWAGETVPFLLLTGDDQRALDERRAIGYDVPRVELDAPPEEVAFRVRQILDDAGGHRLTPSEGTPSVN